MIYKGTVIASPRLNIRSEPNSGSTDIGDLQYQDKIEASEIVAGWWKLSNINGTPTPVGYAYENNGVYIRLDSTVDTPPVEPEWDAKLTTRAGVVTFFKIIP